MKMLFVNQFFWPDSSATSQQLTDLVTTLAQRGHEVHVVSSRSGGYAEAAGTEAPPVTMHTVRSLPFARGKLARLLSYITFYPAAFVRVMTLPRMDVVVSLTTPPLIAMVGQAAKALRGSRHYIWEQDIYPDVATELGHVKPRGVIDRVVGAIADSARKHADGIVALGLCMKLRLVRRGIPAERIRIAENWSNSAVITPLERPGSSDELVLLYSGNLGLAHEVKTLQQSMLTLREDSRFRFIFVGGGGRRRELKEYLGVYGVQSMEERSYVPRDRLSEGLALGDIGLVLQDNACSGLVVPSKVYGIMASGRPILFVGPPDATPALHIREHGCGWQVDCGDHAGLTRLLRHLAEHREEVYAAGQRAREALVTHYDMPLGTERMARILECAVHPQDATEPVREPVLAVPEASFAGNRNAWKGGPA